jgi:hypothetical protein
MELDIMLGKGGGERIPPLFLNKRFSDNVQRVMTTKKVLFFCFLYLYILYSQFPRLLQQTKTG